MIEVGLTVESTEMMLSLFFKKQAIFGDLLKNSHGVFVTYHIITKEIHCYLLKFSMLLFNRKLFVTYYNSQG